MKWNVKLHITEKTRLKCKKFVESICDMNNEINELTELHKTHTNFIRLTELFFISLLLSFQLPIEIVLVWSSNSVSSKVSNWKMRSSEVVRYIEIIHIHLLVRFFFVSNNEIQKYINKWHNRRIYGIGYRYNRASKTLHIWL